MHHSRRDLLQIYREALKAIEGQRCVAKAIPHLPEQDYWNIIAIGKAADAMALGAQTGLGERYRSGLVISKPDHVVDLEAFDQRTTIIYGDHPLPGQASLVAGEALLAFIRELPEDEPILLLVSGGTSSLVEVLPEGVFLEDLTELNRWLLGSGFPIEVMNRVRKRLSQLKGGRLWRYLGERYVAQLFISDVPSNDPRVVGSGLLFGSDEGSLLDLSLPDDFRQLLELGTSAPVDTHPAFSACVASQSEAREAAKAEAERLGYKVEIVPGMLIGDAAEAGRQLANQVLQSPGQLTIWGGETTVRLPEKPGHGGRCQHLALAAASVLAGQDECYLLAVGTDGSDGTNGDAGALVDGHTCYRGESQCFVLEESLKRADSGHFLEASGDLVQTGATGTNVMDLIFGLNTTARS